MKLSLRGRILAACLVVGTGASVFFGGLALVLMELMEGEQVNLILDDEVNRFIGARSLDPGAPAPRSSFIEGWAVGRDSLHELPADLRGLATGVQELPGSARERRAVVRDSGSNRFVVVLDMSLMEPWENHVTGVVIVLVALSAVFSGLLGRMVANQVVSPVTRLAHRVAGSEPLGGQVAFAEGQASDEVGALATALDDYAARLEAFAAREREFAAFASHELRTPLAVIRSSLELTAARPGAADASASLDRAGMAAAQMSATVDALMVLGRVQAGAAEPGTVDVAAIVREVIEDVRCGHTPPGAAITTDLDGSLRVYALPGSVRTVVRNLIDNALHHASGAALAVSLAGGTLCVSDRGPGISGDARRRIFEAFHQGPHADSGAGLGLAIVQRLCDHHAWTLGVQSEPGNGTTVSVRFAS